MSFTVAVGLHRLVERELERVELGGPTPAFHIYLRTVVVEADARADLGGVRVSVAVGIGDGQHRLDHAIEGRRNSSWLSGKSGCCSDEILRKADAAERIDVRWRTPPCRSKSPPCARPTIRSPSWNTKDRRDRLSSSVLIRTVGADDLQRECHSGGREVGANLGAQYAKNDRKNAARIADRTVAGHRAVGVAGNIRIVADVAAGFQRRQTAP